MLQEETTIGIKVLALIHSGKISIKCSDCNEETQNVYSCGKTSDELVFEEDDLKLYTCPLTYITQQVYDFFDEMSYYETFIGTAPKYGEHSVRFWEMVKVYKQVYNKYLYEEKDNKVDNTDNELAKLKAGFDKSKRK